MKRIIALLVLGLALTAARADFVIQQKVESPMQNGEMTVKIKGDKIRVDMSSAMLGDMSTITDSGTGDSVVLMHKSKSIMKMSGAQVKQVMEAMRKQMGNGAATNAMALKPVATGKTEKVGDYDAEIYTWTNSRGMSQILWVAKDFPEYSKINAQLEKLGKSVAGGMSRDMSPDISTLPGMVVKSQADMAGQKVITTLISAKEETVESSAFEAPKDYQDMAQPGAALAAPQKESPGAKIQAGLAVGTQFPDFNEKDLAGKSLSISNYKGKVVLIDFWATWCGPCVGELPNVLKTYQKYHGKGLEIIGVSLDQDQAKLASFIQQKGVTWQQFFDGQGWHNKLAVKYGIESIPATFLLDGQGKIIAKDLRGEALDQAVGAALAAK